MEVSSVYEVAPDLTATLAVTTINRGDAADWLRAERQTSRLEDLSKKWLEYYRKAHGEVDSTSLPELTDDRQANVLTVLEKYRLQRPFGEAGHMPLPPTDLSRFLEEPSKADLCSPLRLPHPTWVSVRDTVTMPWEFAPFLSSSAPSNTAFRAQIASHTDGRTQYVFREYRSATRELSPAQAQDYTKALEALRTSFEVSIEGSAPDQTETIPEVDWQVLATTGAIIASVGGGVVGLLLLGRWSNRRRIREWQRMGARHGESPAQSIAVDSLEEARSQLNRARCHCGEASDALETTFTTLRFGGGLRHLGTARCRGCGKPLKRYFLVADP